MGTILYHCPDDLPGRIPGMLSGLRSPATCMARPDLEVSEHDFHYDVERGRGRVSIFGGSEDGAIILSIVCGTRNPLGWSASAELHNDVVAALLGAGMRVFTNEELQESEAIRDLACDSSLSETQRIERFLEIVRRKPCLRPFSEDADLSDAVVIGVAAGWSNEDLLLLHEFVMKRSDRLKDSTVIHVFDFSEIKSEEQLLSRIPGLGRVYRSPVFALFKDGQEVFSASGHEAKLALEKCYR